MFKTTRLFAVPEKSPKRGRKKTPHFLDLPRSETKLNLTLRSFREARAQCKLASHKNEQPDSLRDRLALLEASLHDLQQTTRSLSRETTSRSPLGRSLVKSPSRTKSAGRTLYTPSKDLMRLASAAKTLLALSDETEEGHINTRQLRILQISRDTKCDKEREETEERSRESIRRLPSVSPVRKAPSGKLCRTRIHSLKCLQKTLEDPDVQPEPAYHLSR